MFKFYTFLLIATATFLVACSNEKQEQPSVSELTEEVMAIHDAVMPINEDLYNMAIKLKSEADSAMIKGDTAQAEALQATAQELNAAYNAMMGWMRSFELPADDDSQEESEIINYLQEEKQKIQEVKIQMEAAYEKGKAAIENVQ